MVTREEKHSTRGRAHLLWEMLQGSVIGNQWRSEEVKDALDLCLACKGCKHECPVEVDLATYKAEFLSHYYEGRLRPLSAYAMGMIDLWCRVALLAPGVANFVLQNPLFGGLAKKLVGIALQRRIPRFATHTFTKWFKSRTRKNETAPKIILWPDTFNKYFHPEVAIAAVEVLEAAGFQVAIPSKPLCCGRPLYDYGMLSRARKLLLEILEALQPEIHAGVPVVGLEPSCVAVFRDEMLNLFPDNEDARRLSQQTFLLSEFLAKKAPDFPVPRIEGRALVHGHCHHRSVIGFGLEETVLKGTGLELRFPDSGCCGMAGSFGFEAGHYDVSLKVGERVLLPSIRQVSAETLIVANGFSCREQIEQATGRKTLHLAQLLRSALKS